MDCKFLSSPTAGEISPPRLRFDRFLPFQSPPKEKLMSTKVEQTDNTKRIRLEGNPYKAMTAEVRLSQSTPLQEQWSSASPVALALPPPAAAPAPAPAGVQSKSMLATLLKEALSDNSAIPVVERRVQARRRRNRRKRRGKWTFVRERGDGRRDEQEQHCCSDHETRRRRLLSLHSSSTLEASQAGNREGRGTFLDCERVSEE